MAERAGARRAGLVADVHDSVEVEEEASNPSASLTTAEAYPPGCGRAHQAEHWPEQPPALPAARRYEYFIKRSASHGELWGLHGDGGWVMAEDDDGNTHFPVWAASAIREGVLDRAVGGRRPSGDRCRRVGRGLDSTAPKGGIPDRGPFRRPRIKESGSPRKDSNAISRRSSRSSSFESGIGSVGDASRACGA